MSKKEELKISEFFRQNFEEQSNTDLGWNTPPDFLFEEAIAQVNGKRTESNRTKLMILAGVAVVALLFVMLFSHMSRLDALEADQPVVANTISEVVKQAEKPDLSAIVTNQEVTTSHEVKADDNKAKVTVVDNPTAISQEVQPTTSIAATTRANNSVSRISDSKNNASNASDQVATTQKTEIEERIVENRVNKKVSSNSDSGARNLTQNNVANNLTAPSAPHNSKIAAIEILSKIELSTLATVEREVPVSRAVEQLPVETNALAASKIGFRVAHNLSTLRIDSDNANNITNHNNFYSGYGFDFDIKTPLTSRLSLVNTVGFNKYSNESDNTIIHPYKKFKEVLITTDRASYDLSSFVETPLGRLEEEQTFFVDPRSTVDGENLEHSMTFSQELSVASLQTGLSYDITQADKLTWSVGITAGLNMVVDLKSTMFSSYKMDNSIETEDIIAFENSDNINNFYGSLNLRTDLSYTLGKNLELNFGLGYLHGLSSITNYANNSSRTYLQNFSGQIGLYRRF